MQLLILLWWPPSTMTINNIYGSLMEVNSQLQKTPVVHLYYEGPPSGCCVQSFSLFIFLCIIISVYSWRRRHRSFLTRAHWRNLSASTASLSTSRFTCGTAKLRLWRNPLRWVPLSYPIPTSSCYIPMFYRKMKKQKRNPQKNLKVMKKMMRKLKLKKKKKKNPKQRRLNTERGTCASQLK